MQAGGQEFDPPQVHIIFKSNVFPSAKMVIFSSRSNMLKKTFAVILFIFAFLWALGAYLPANNSADTPSLLEKGDYVGLVGGTVLCVLLPAGLGIWLWQSSGKKKG